MPIFVVHALDHPTKGPAIRAENRPAHLNWASELGDKLKIGGPLMSDDGQNMIGSLMVIDYDNLEALKAHLATDPYAIGGLFHRVDVRPFKWLLGADLLNP